jgi:hypothetical protein
VRHCASGVARSNEAMDMSRYGAVIGDPASDFRYCGSLQVERGACLGALGAWCSVRVAPESLIAERISRGSF